MLIADALALAKRLIDQHKLKGWKACIDTRPTRRLGECRFDTRAIGLSQRMVEYNSAAFVSDVVLHEIAHALAGYEAAHGKKWQAIMLKLGAMPTRTRCNLSVRHPDLKFRAVCLICWTVHYRHKSPAKPLYCQCTRGCSERPKLTFEKQPGVSHEDCQPDLGGGNGHRARRARNLRVLDCG